ncbi:MAG TPA: PLP-dependent aminotransferase family protein [Burkholderiales bacterium]|nr:PLP-dependent aminotransferase family protein [Burkholderiales bacterium]
MPMNSSRPPFTRWIESSNTITQQFLSIGGRADIVSLAGGLPAAELYPVDAIREAADRALKRWGTKVLEYGPVEGLHALREAIAARTSAECGGRFTADNVMLMTGAMQGLDLMGKVLVDPGDLIVAQAPTYLGALDAWRPRGPRYEKLDWNLDRPGFDAALARAKFAYVVPNYSNPTGALVPQAKRLALLEKVRAAGTWLLEDDPYHSIHFDGEPGPDILESDAARYPDGYDGPVVYLGTLSKSIVPGLRVGWAIAAPAMIGKLALAKQSSDLSSSIFTQAVALELLESGFDVSHAHSINELYRERRDVLCDEAAARIGEWFEWEVPAGGMFVWMRAKDARIDTDRLYELALEEKVAFVPGSVFDPDGRDRSAMRVNFTRSAPEVIVEGVRRLERAIRKYLHR